MLFRVPGARSSLGFPGTVTRPGFEPCLSWQWAALRRDDTPTVVMQHPQDLADCHRASISGPSSFGAGSLLVRHNARFSRRSERSEPRSAGTGSSADASTDFRPDDPRQIFLAGTSGIPVCRRKASTAPAGGLVRRGRDHSSRSEGAHAVAADEAGSPASPDDDLNVFSSLSAQVRTQRADLHPRIATSSQGTPPRVREECEGVAPLRAVVPGLFACLYCRWLPRVRANRQPSSSRSRISSPSFTLFPCHCRCRVTHG